MNLLDAAERVVLIECDSNTQIGVLTPSSGTTGVVIVVGGPQYRVGSHRMFVHIARFLAARGYPVLRFDTRGMGDSTAEFPGFTGISPDIASAVDAMCREAACERVILLGLCDGASAAAMYGYTDARVVGLSLINPWVRTVEGESRARLEGYYGRRVLQPKLWKDLLTGELNVLRSVRELFAVLRDARSTQTESFITEMQKGLTRFPGSVQIALSGDDLVALEFEHLAKTADWERIIRAGRVQVDRFPSADHTFSGDGQISRLCRAVAQWLDQAKY
jgi:uncharacterized protein